MKKSDRLKLLKYRAAVLGFVPMFAGLLSVSQSEIGATVHEVTKDKIETVDDEETQWESSLAVDTVPDKFGEESLTLSQKERAQIAADVYNVALAKRLPYAIALRVERPDSEQDLNSYRELSSFAHS